MNETREAILATLTAAGISNKTVEDVIAEFKASDELAVHLAGAVSEEQAVMAHLPQYLELQGLMADATAGAAAAAAGAAAATTPQDPAETQPVVNVAMPAQITPAQQSAIREVLQRNNEARMLNSEQSKMVAVLTDRPYPGEYMEGIDKLQVKDREKYITELKSHCHPDTKLEELLSKPSTYFIPNNAQLQQLQTLYLQQHKETKNQPTWFGFDNDAAYKQIQDTLDAGGSFQVYIPPLEDQGEGIYKNKAWRWNTKGFVLRMPSDSPGDASYVERDVTTGQLKGMLLSHFAGYIGNKDGGLGCRLRTVVSKKKAGVSATAEQKKPRLQVVGNNRTVNPELRVTKERLPEPKKGTERSADFFLVCRINKNGLWSVKNQRVPLEWLDQPAWGVKQQYQKLFGSQTSGRIGTPGVEERANIEMARNLMLQQAMADPEKHSDMDLGSLLNAVEESVNRSAEKAAAAIAL